MLTRVSKLPFQNAELLTAGRDIADTSCLSSAATEAKSQTCISLYRSSEDDRYVIDSTLKIESHLRGVPQDLF